MTPFLTGTCEARSQAGPVDWLCLAATPIFAAMALATVGDGDMLCTMPGMSALGGMSVMYLLMSLFHAAPWLKRMTQSRKGE